MDDWRSELHLDANDPPSFQVGHLWTACLPEATASRLEDLHHRFPIRGLSSHIGKEFSRGQWLIFTEGHMIGQICNGGLMQFFENFPGLVGDGEMLLREYGKPEFYGAYVRVASPLLDLQKEWSQGSPLLAGQELQGYWDEVERVHDQLEQLDMSLFDKLVAYNSDRDVNPHNWVTHLDLAVIGYVLVHPEDFRPA